MPDVGNPQPADAQHLSTSYGYSMSENSMRLITENRLNHVVDVKTRCQGIVLSTSYYEVNRVVVKLISKDVIDQVYYDLSGEDLQIILKERYTDISFSIKDNAIIPFSLFGNLPLTDDSFIQVSITLRSSGHLFYDRIITAFDASNPIVVKRLSDVSEFESLKYDEMFFQSDTPADLSYNHNGRRVYTPQLLYFNQLDKLGYSSQKLVPDTVYQLSEAKDILLVEY